MSALDAGAGSQQPVTPFGALVQSMRANCRAKDAFRISFGLIWLIVAALKWEPAFRSGFTATLKEAAQGQPGWLHGWFHKLRQTLTASTSSCQGRASAAGTPG